MEDLEDRAMRKGVHRILVESYCLSEEEAVPDHCSKESRGWSQVSSRLQPCLACGVVMTRSADIPTFHSVRTTFSFSSPSHHQETHLSQHPGWSSPSGQQPRQRGPSTPARRQVQPSPSSDSRGMKNINYYLALLSTPSLIFHHVYN